MLFITSANAGKDKEQEAVLPDTELIDIPTAGILDYYGFLVRTRVFSGGGVLSALSFGVLERLNLGASMIIDKLVGSGSPVKLVRPEIHVKFRFYDGGYYLPALALGYDGQGYFYDTDLKKYMEKERGLYLIGSREIGVSNLMAHAGFNISDFDDNLLYGFLGFNYTIEDKISLLVEYDEFFHESVNERFNIGTRIYITPFFHLDLSVREIGKDKTFDNNDERKAERIVQLRYNTSF
jgi:hypothetical protein